MKHAMRHSSDARIGTINRRGVQNAVTRVAKVPGFGNQAIIFLTKNASASRDGALHSTPRSPSSDQKVSSLNQDRLAWEENASNNLRRDQAQGRLRNRAGRR